MQHKTEQADHILMPTVITILSKKELDELGFIDSREKEAVNSWLNEHPWTGVKNMLLVRLKEIKEKPQKYMDFKPFDQLITQLQGISAKTNTDELKSTKTSTLTNSILPYTILGEDYIDDGSRQQMDKAMQLPIAAAGALMPDAHQGYGLPIGGVFAAKDAVIPYGVGMDIGCRMCLSAYPEELIKRFKKPEKLEHLLLEESRFGTDYFKERKAHAVLEDKAFDEIPFLRGLKDKAYEQFGTSGQGNHFIDLGLLTISEDRSAIGLPNGRYFAMLSHSGSRALGAEIARHYTRIAKSLRQLPKGFTELSWLYLSEEEGQEYWRAMELAGAYSRANHEFIHQRMAKALGVDALQILQNHHNFAWKESLPGIGDVVVHRKGATPAQDGVMGIIPGSMTAPAFVIRGAGDEKSLYSASHGAGRLMSRKAAKRSISKAELQSYLKKNGVHLIGGNVDEAPWVYKNIERVMEYQKDQLEILAKFEPRMVRMASG